jgi:hypothetical protein
MDDTMLNSMNASWNSPVGQHSQQLVNKANSWSTQSTVGQQSQQMDSSSFTSRLGAVHRTTHHHH